MFSPFPPARQAAPCFGRLQSGAYRVFWQRPIPEVISACSSDYASTNFAESWQTLVTDLPKILTVED